MLILGIDPGLATTGFAVVLETDGKAQLQAYGCIRTPAGVAEPERLLIIYRSMEELLSQHDIACLAIEKLFFNTNVTTALSVGQARGLSYSLPRPVALRLPNTHPCRLNRL